MVYLIVYCAATKHPNKWTIAEFRLKKRILIKIFDKVWQKNFDKASKIFMKFGAKIYYTS